MLNPLRHRVASLSKPTDVPPRSRLARWSGIVATWSLLLAAAGCASTPQNTVRVDPFLENGKPLASRNAKPAQTRPSRLPESAVAHAANLGGETEPHSTATRPRIDSRVRPADNIVETDEFRGPATATGATCPTGDCKSRTPTKATGLFDVESELVPVNPLPGDAPTSTPRPATRPLPNSSTRTNVSSPARPIATSVPTPHGGAIRRVSATGEAYCPPGFGPGSRPIPAFQGDPNLAFGPGRYPDEYLFDGGDRKYPVTYSDYSIEGLDTEDTVIEYNDDKGARKVKPSNRVAVYAPRFAAVAAISYPVDNQKIDVLAGADTSTFAPGLVARQGTVHHNKLESTGRIVTRLRGSSMLSRQFAKGHHHEIATASHTKDVVPLILYDFVNTGTFKQADEPVLAHAIQSAQTWTRDQSPAISAQVQRGQDVKAVFRPADLTGEKEGERTPGQLRIVKLADKREAQPGDVITFTIRYDNIGDREVTDAAIIDNLTPRLEYIVDSATSDRDGELTVADNGEGSLILRWSIEGSIKGRTGGVVTFQAKVK